MDHGRKEGLEGVRKEEGNEGNNMHGAWKEGGERVGKKKEGTYQRQGEGKSMKERKETEKEGRKEGRCLEHGRKQGRKEGRRFLPH